MALGVAHAEIEPETGEHSGDVGGVGRGLARPEDQAKTARQDQAGKHRRGFVVQAPGQQHQEHNGQDAADRRWTSCRPFIHRPMQRRRQQHKPVRTQRFVVVGAAVDGGPEIVGSQLHFTRDLGPAHLFRPEGTLSQAGEEEQPGKGQHERHAPGPARRRGQRCRRRWSLHFPPFCHGHRQGRIHSTSPLNRRWRQGSPRACRQFRDPGFLSRCLPEGSGFRPAGAMRQWAEPGQLGPDQQHHADNNERAGAAADNREHRAEQPGGDAGFKSTQLVGRADEQAVDGRHPTAQVIRRQHLHQGAAHYHADVVQGPGECQHGQRKNEIIREAKDDRGHAKARHGGEERRSGAAQRRPVRQHHGHHRGPQRGRRPQQPEARGIDMQDVARINRQQRRRSTQQHGEQIECDGRQQQPRPEHEVQPG